MAFKINVKNPTVQTTANERSHIKLDGLKTKTRRSEKMRVAQKTEHNPSRQSSRMLMTAQFAWPSILGLAKNTIL